MKYFILVLILGLFFMTEQDLAQTNKIAAVRKEVERINKNQSKLTETKRDVEGISGEGTEAKFFAGKSGVEKITANIYGETGRSSVELYYKSAQLIFAFEVESNYDGTFGKVISKTEKRYYFENGELFSMLSGKTQIKNDNERYAEMKENIIAISSQLLSAYTSE